METDARDAFAIIIGSGFAGLAMAIELKRAGIHDFVVLEKASAVGGTWRDNVYPGCACDVPSHLYSYSFELNGEWSRAYAEQREIRAYIERCATKYDLRPHIRFDAEVSSAVYDEERSRWTVRTRGGDVFRARLLVSAMGGLSRPSMPKIEGIERFRGVSFHSATWPRDLSLRGKSVAVVGTGASAIQFVPEIAPEVRRLHVFQRTAPWILPRGDRAFTSFERRVLRARPGRWLYRQSLYLRQELYSVGFVNEPRLLRLAQGIARSHLAKSIPDRALRKKLSPDYVMGCKRILVSNDYYPALARPNVEVVTEPIAEVTETGVVTRDGVERPVDAVIYGTGFDVHRYLGPVRVVGRGGRELGETWRRGASAYLGSAVPGFPNLFTLIGPNTGLGHNSIIVMIEAQVRYVMDCVRMMRRDAIASVEVRPEVMERFNERIQARLKGTVWQTGCRSWYINEDGLNTTLWPGTTLEFRLRTRRFDRSSYRLGREA